MRKSLVDAEANIRSFMPCKEGFTTKIRPLALSPGVSLATARMWRYTNLDNDNFDGLFIWRSLPAFHRNYLRQDGYNSLQWKFKPEKATLISRISVVKRHLPIGTSKYRM